jgi:hypothetical protein
MIGYVKIFKPELKIKEFQVYNSYYCGICQALGKRYGLVFRNLLNYDAVFLAIALDSINEHKSDYESFRCILHPVKKKLRCVNNKAVEFASDITVYLTYKKLMDDINDEKSIGAKIGAMALKSAYRKAEREIKGLSDIIENNLSRLAGLEDAKSDSIDETADCYGEIYRNIFLGFSSVEPILETAVGWLAYNIGRWIYIVDAYDDIESDIKKNQYNPILNRFEYDKGTDVSAYKANIRDRMSYILYSALDEASKAYDLIDKTVNSSIIRNILYEGLYSVTEIILNGDTCNGTKESI